MAIVRVVGVIQKHKVEQEDDRTPIWTPCRPSLLELKTTIYQMKNIAGELFE